MIKRIALWWGALVLASCGELDEPGMVGSPTFPIAMHVWIPQSTVTTGQVATGETQGESPTRALEQPIAFPHYTHATTLGMQCEYCHVDARKSIHSGVPATQVCMGCHKWVKKDSPEIIKLAEYYNKGEPIPWKKVHDLPDYVQFAHNRHIRAGLQCIECHGQVQLMGRVLSVPDRPVSAPAPGNGAASAEVPAEGSPVDGLLGSAAYAAEGEGAGEAEAAGAGEHEGHAYKEVQKVAYPMVRETTLQMGWCLECHATHPSIDANYGERADARRAELKDCWTCHK